MLRVHFTTEDLLRIKISAKPHPLWEVLLSLHLLQTNQDTLIFDGWRHDVRKALKPSVAMLTTLARPQGYSPDFLTPAGGTDLDTGIEALLSTGRRELRADIVNLAGETAIPPWVSSVGDGEVGALNRLASSIRTYHTGALRPYWDIIQTHIQADHSRRVEAVTNGGCERLLETLHPTMTWRSPVLEVAYPVDLDIYLKGRGLVLTPSFFCWQHPITLADQERPPILVYPIEHEVGWAKERLASTGGQQLCSPRPQSLATLLGRTRATVLRAIADTPHSNTSELARVIGISLASASTHAAVLRDAGLVITHRRNGWAQHELSSRGVSLLDDRTLSGCPPA